MSEDLGRDIAAVLNAHGIDNDSNTPDYILATYLIGCLDAYRRAVSGTRSATLETVRFVPPAPPGKLPFPPAVTEIVTPDGTVTISGPS